MKNFTIIVGNFHQNPGVWYWVNQVGEDWDLNQAAEEAAGLCTGLQSTDPRRDTEIAKIIEEGYDCVAVLEGPVPNIVYE